MRAASAEWRESEHLSGETELVKEEVAAEAPGSKAILSIVFLCKG